MEYVARKISRAKWELKSYMESDDIGADAVTGCLRTSNNTLSVWQCSLEETDVAEVVLALATPMERIDKIDVVLIHKNDLDEDGCILEATLGNTLVDDLRARHMDIININLTKLCSLARRIATKVRQNSNCYLFTKSKVQDIIVKAVKNNRLDVDSLNEKVRIEIQKKL